MISAPALLTESRLFQIGKQGVGFLLHADHLGGINGAAFSRPVCGGGYGGTAYADPYLYVPCADGLVALRLSGFSFTIAWRSPTIDAGPPIVLGGLAWTLDTAGGQLYGFDQATGKLREQISVGGVERFAPLSADNGHLFVPTANGVAALTSS